MGDASNGAVAAASGINAAAAASGAWQRAGSSGLTGSGKGPPERPHRASRASDAGSEGGMSDAGMSVMSGDSEFTYKSSGEPMNLSR